MSTGGMVRVDEVDTDLLCDLLDHKGESISSLARTLNRERSNLYRAVHNERRMPYTLLHDIAEFLDVPVRRLGRIAQPVPCPHCGRDMTEAS